MARRFERSSSQALYIHSAPVTAYPFTLACWVYCHSFASSWGDEPLVALTDKDDGYDRDVLAIYQAGGTSPYLTAVSSTNWDAHSRSPGAGVGVSTGSWFHAAAVFASTTSRVAAVDGTFGTEATTTISPNARTSVGAACLPRTAGPEGGSYTDSTIAEIGIWNVALTEAELGRLALGVSPLLVRPDALVFYLPLVRDEDRDLVAGLSFTAANSPTVVAHPRIIYPARLWTGYTSGGSSVPEAEGTAHVSATASTAATVSKASAATAAVEGLSSASASGAKVAASTAAIGSLSTTAATASKAALATAAIQGEGQTSADGTATEAHAGTVALSAIGTTDADGAKAAQAMAVPDASATSDVTAAKAAHSAATPEAVGSTGASGSAGEVHAGSVAIEAEASAAATATTQREGVGAPSAVATAAAGARKDANAEASITAVASTSATGTGAETITGEAHVAATASVLMDGAKGARGDADAMAYAVPASEAWTARFAAGAAEAIAWVVVLGTAPLCYLQLQAVFDADGVTVRAVCDADPETMMAVYDTAAVRIQGVRCA